MRLLARCRRRGAANRFIERGATSQDGAQDAFENVRDDIRKKTASAPKMIHLLRNLPPWRR